MTAFPGDSVIYADVTAGIHAGIYGIQARRARVVETTAATIVELVREHRNDIGKGTRRG